MALINQRWPEDLCPVSCSFGATRNDVQQRSPRTRQPSVIRQGRKLWTAELTWRLPRTDKLAKLRYLLEALEGFAGSVQLWDFSNPYPEGMLLAEPTAGRRMLWTAAGSSSYWAWAGLPSHWAYGATVQVGASASIGATSVSLSGLAPSRPAAVQGQYVQVGRRLYIAADSAASDASGNATIPLLSPLLSPAVAGDVARLVAAGCEMQLADQNTNSSSSAGDIVSMSARFIETVEDFV